MQTEKEQIQNQIQELQEKLKKLEEVENEKMEFKDEGKFHFFHYNGKPYQRLEYTVIPNVSWFVCLTTLEFPIPIYEKVMNSELNKKLEELYHKEVVKQKEEYTYNVDETQKESVYHITDEHGETNPHEKHLS